MKIALLGNPNTGKSSVFNLLTGMRQKIGNFPGVTVEKKSGFYTSGNESVEIIADITFSSTVMRLKTLIFWNVLDTPNL